MVIMSRTPTADGKFPAHWDGYLTNVSIEQIKRHLAEHGEVVEAADAQTKAHPFFAECVCGQPLCRTGETWRHLNPATDKDHDAYPVRVAKQSGRSTRPANQRKMSMSTEEPTVATKALPKPSAKGEYRRTLSCGHVKPWGTAKDPKDLPTRKTPICEECEGRPTRGVTKLEERRSGKWVEVEIPNKPTGPKGGGGAKKASATKAPASKRTAKQAAADKEAGAATKKEASRQRGIELAKTMKAHRADKAAAEARKAARDKEQVTPTPKKAAAKKATPAKKATAAAAVSKRTARYLLQKKA